MVDAIIYVKIVLFTTTLLYGEITLAKLRKTIERDHQLIKYCQTIIELLKYSREHIYKYPAFTPIEHINYGKIYLTDPEAKRKIDKFNKDIKKCIKIHNLPLQMIKTNCPYIIGYCFTSDNYPKNEIDEWDQGEVDRWDAEITQTTKQQNQDLNNE